jgi:hypothetical protein
VGLRDGLSLGQVGEDMSEKYYRPKAFKLPEGITETGPIDGLPLYDFEECTKEEYEVYRKELERSNNALRAMGEWYPELGNLFKEDL